MYNIIDLRTSLGIISNSLEYVDIASTVTPAIVNVPIFDCSRWSQLRVLKLNLFSHTSLKISEIQNLEHLSFEMFSCTTLHLAKCKNLKIVRFSAASPTNRSIPSQQLSILIEKCAISKLLTSNGDTIQEIALEGCTEIKRIRMNGMSQLKCVKMHITLLRSLHWQYCDAMETISLRIGRLVSLYSDHHLLSKLIQQNYYDLLNGLKCFGYNIVDSSEGIPLDEVLQQIATKQLFKFAIIARESYLKRGNKISDAILSKMMLEMDRVEYLDLGNVIELENKHLELLTKKIPPRLKQIKLSSCRNVNPNELIPFIRQSSTLRMIKLGTTKYDIKELQKTCIEEQIRLQVDISSNATLF